MKKKKRTLKKAVDPISLSITLLIIASLVLFNVLPLVKVLIQSFTDAEGTYSFGGYIRAFQFKQNRDAMVHTLVSSVSAAAIATVIGFIFAYCACYIKMRAKKFFNVIAILPIISPPFSVSLSIILLFGNKGLITHTLLGIPSGALL